MVLSFTGDCPSYCSPVAPRLCPRGARASSWATSGPQPGLKSVCLLPNVPGGPDSFWVPWCIVLNPAAPTKSLVSTKGEKWWCWKGSMSWGCLTHSFCLHHSGSFLRTQKVLDSLVRNKGNFMYLFGARLYRSTMYIGQWLQAAFPI